MAAPSDPPIWMQMVERVRHGGKLSDALTDTAALPTMAVRMLRFGEETGQLPMLAGRVAEFYEAKLQRSLDRIVGIAGPAAIIAISIIVGGLIVSVMTALLSVSQIVGMRRSQHDPALAKFIESAARAQRGFTLVEILVVITIIALIMGMVGPRVLNYLSESKAKAAKIQIESFSSALDLFYLDTGRYPSGSEGLVALVRAPGNIAAWNGPYLKGGSVPADPWGNPYVYRSPGEHGAYDILSYGSDGKKAEPAQPHDITSWQR